jgi:threonyl-tRNA synthetase
LIKAQYRKLKNSLSMINITFPDGHAREYEAGVTGFDIAQSISPRLAKEVLSVTVNGNLWDIGNARAFW